MKIANETKIGILTAFAIACLILGYNFLKGNNLFSSSKKYYAIYERVDGLAVSNPVLVNGFQVGRVAELIIQPDKKIKVRFDVEAPVTFPKNSIAEIQTPALLSAKAIVMQIPAASSDVAPEETVFASSIEASLGDSLDPIKEKAEKLLVSADSILTAMNQIINPQFRTNMQNSMMHLETTMKHMDETTAKINSSTDKLGNIMSNMESISLNLKNNNAKINNIMDNMNTFSDQLAKGQIQETLLSANKSMAQVNALMTQIKKGDGSIGLLLNDNKLYENLNKSASDLDALMVDLKQNPKRYVHFSLFGGGGKEKKKVVDTVK